MAKNSNTFPLPLVPIVLAGSPHLEHWPLSRVDRPIQFERNRGHYSAFQRSLLLSHELLALNSSAGVPSEGSTGKNTPMVCIAPAIITEAYAQAREIGVHFTPIIEPIERGSAPASLTASLLTEERFGPSLLLILDVLALPQNKDDLVTIVTQAVTSGVLKEHILVCADRASAVVAHGDEIVQASGTLGHPRQFKIGDPATRDAGNGSTNRGLRKQPTSVTQARRYALQDLILCTSSHWRRAVATLSNGCAGHIADALQARPDLAQDPNRGHVQGRDNKAIWPNTTHYGLCEHTSMGDVLRPLRQSIVFRPIAMASVTSSARGGFSAPSIDPSYSVIQPGEAGQSFALLDSIDCETTGSGHMVALVGCDGLKVVTTEDATLITNRDNSAPTDDLVAAMREREHPALLSRAEAQHAWGSERILHEDNGHRICCLTILAGRSMEMTVHMRRSEFWYVLSGNGIARVDGEIYTLEPGASHEITPRQPHGLTNTGEQPLIVVEARRGAYLGTSDTYPAETDDVSMTELL